MRILEQFLLWVHGLSAAAWFGGIFYRTLVIDPKAFRYFRDRGEYERFSTHLAHGMRSLVIAGLLTCGLSGFALLGLRWDAAANGLLGLMSAKIVVWLLACGLFAYVSWVHWPWRAFAAPEEFRDYRRQGIVLAAGMVILAGTGFALGQACRSMSPL
jgi:putative copper export protein